MAKVNKDNKKGNRIIQFHCKVLSEQFSSTWANVSREYTQSTFLHMCTHNMHMYDRCLTDVVMLQIISCSFSSFLLQLNLDFVCPKYFSPELYRLSSGSLPVPNPLYFHLLVIDLDGDTPGSSRLSLTWLDVITLFLLTM